MTDEYLDAIDALWTKESATYHGEYVSFDDLAMFPKPIQEPRPPIWIGGRSDAAHRRAARIGDGWIPSQASVEVLDEGKQRIEALAAEMGQSAPVDWGVNVFTSIADTDDKARDAMRATMGHRFKTDDALFSATIAGAPDTVLAHIDRYRAVGLNVIDLKVAPVRIDSVMAQMEVFAREILPALREGAA